MRRLGVIFILLLAFSGLADTLYLAQHENSGAPLLCNIQNLSGCNIVATSKYSHIFGISLAEFGVLFYGIIFVLAALEMVLFNRVVRRILYLISVVGLLASLYFTYIQIFLIKALCIYCLASALITFFIFGISGLIAFVGKQPVHEPPTS